VVHTSWTADRVVQCGEQKLRRGRYAVTTDLPTQDRVRAALVELA
jgi:hypothetical protein